MNKLFLTMTLALVTMFASAQIMVITTVEQPADDAEWEVRRPWKNAEYREQFENDGSNRERARVVQRAREQLAQLQAAEN